LGEFWRRVNWQRAARQREQIVLGVRAVAAQFAAVANLVLLEGQMREWRRPGLSARQLGAIEVKM
jgi:primosomal protein N'